MKKNKKQNNTASYFFLNPAPAPEQGASAF